MATNATLHLELLECIICKETYTDPIDLHCGHNFCRQCIVDYACNVEQQSMIPKECVCPICRKPMDLSASELRTKPSNYTLKNIIAAVKANNEISTTKCSNHNKDHIIYCETCNEAKCFKCFKGTCKAYHVTEDLDGLGKQLQQDIQQHLLVTSNGHHKETDFSQMETDLEKLEEIKSKLITENHEV